jgi:hypothetical protein
MGIGFYDHTVGYFSKAGRRQRRRPLYLNHTYPARPRLVDAFHITQAGYADVILPRGLYDSCAFLCQYFKTINRQTHHYHMTIPFLESLPMSELL